MVAAGKLKNSDRENEMSKKTLIERKATPGKLLAEKGRPYVLDATMRLAAERARYQPKLLSMGGQITDFQIFYRD